MTPASLFRLMDPRRITRGAAAFAMGFTVSQSDVELSLSHIQAVRDYGAVRCGVDTGLPGFAIEDDSGDWSGFEVDLCRAYAAAFLGQPDQIEIYPLTAVERFHALESGQVDILLRNTSWTLSRATQRDIRFTGVYYYDGQGFVVPADLGLTSAQELSGARICVEPGTTSALNLEDYAQRFGLNFTIVSVEAQQDAREAYQSGECDAFTTDISRLAGFRASLEASDQHIILPDVISKEPLSPVVRSGDSRFALATEWVLMALIAAEEYGVTAENAADLASSPSRPEIGRLLGSDPELVKSIGLDEGFALRAIAAGGHYGQMFDRHLGAQSELGLSRGLNAQWNQGGLMYAPPFR